MQFWVAKSPKLKASYGVDDIQTSIGDTNSEF
jgi:hypothetical protein